MKAKSWIMLRLLINRFHEGREDDILKGMDQEDQQMVLAQKISSSDLAPAMQSPREKLEKIHYSWLTSNISNIPNDKIPLVLSLLPEPMALKLKDFLKQNISTEKAAPPFQEFLFNQFLDKLQLEDVTPFEYLPESSLTVLSKLKKSEIVDLIDFLGIYDLADEVKRIVDRNKLKQIYETLTPKKHEFLRQCLHLREKLVTPKLNLEQWDGDHDKLNAILYKRGMTRLGYALSGKPQDFIWHIVHALDVGRGNYLLKQINKEAIPGVTQTVTIQVLNVIKFFKG